MSECGEGSQRASCWKQNLAEGETVKLERRPLRRQMMAPVVPLILCRAQASRAEMR